MPRRTAVVKILTRAEIEDALADWLDELEGRNLSANTIKSYRDGVTGFLSWAGQSGRPPALDEATVGAFTREILARSERSAATAHSRQVAVRRLSKWMAGKGIIRADQLAGMRRVDIGESALKSLTDEQLAALFRACKGKAFVDRRDEALIRLMAETGLRASEAAGLEIAGLDRRARSVVVWKGKGGKGRLVSYGPQTASAMNDYVRARAARVRGEAAALWIGHLGRPVGYPMVYAAVKRRMIAAGIPVGEKNGFTPHSLRRTWAVRWRQAGGSEAGLMAVGGWSRLESIAPYIRAASERLAAEEARRLDLGNL